MNQPYPSEQPEPVDQQPYQGTYAGRSDALYNATNLGSAQVQREYQAYIDPAGNVIQSRVDTYEDKNKRRAHIRYTVERTTYAVLGLLEVLLLLRLLFHLLGANTDNGFITLLYGLSHIFVVAFNGIFNDQAIGKSGVFEWSTVTAMIVYALLAWGIVKTVEMIYAPIHSSRQTVTTTRRRQL